MALKACRVIGGFMLPVGVGLSLLFYQALMTSYQQEFGTYPDLSIRDVVVTLIDIRTSAGYLGFLILGMTIAVGFWITTFYLIFKGKE